MSGRYDVSESDALARGFSAGNYASAYTSENLNRAWREVKAGEDESYREYGMGAHRGAYRAAFVLGFFSSFEDNEVPREEWLDELIAAEHTYGAKMRALGIAVDPRGPPSMT